MEVITDSNHNVEEVKIGMLCTGEVSGAGFELFFRGIKSRSSHHYQW